MTEPAAAEQTVNVLTGNASNTFDLCSGEKEDVVSENITTEPVTPTEIQEEHEGFDVKCK